MPGSHSKKDKLKKRVAKLPEWKPKKGKYPVVHPDKYSTGGDLLDRITAARDYQLGLFTPEDEIKFYSQIIKNGLPNPYLRPDHGEAIQITKPVMEGFIRGSDATISTGVISPTGEINWEQFEDLVGQMDKGLGEGKTPDEIAETAVVKKVRPPQPTDKDRGDVMEARLRKRIAKVRKARTYRTKARKKPAEITSRKGLGRESDTRASELTEKVTERRMKEDYESGGGMPKGKEVEYMEKLQMTPNRPDTEDPPAAMYSTKKNLQLWSKLKKRIANISDYEKKRREDPFLMREEKSMYDSLTDKEQMDVGRGVQDLRKELKKQNEFIGPKQQEFSTVATDYRGRPIIPDDITKDQISAYKKHYEEWNRKFEDKRGPINWKGRRGTYKKKRTAKIRKADQQDINRVKRWNSRSFNKKKELSGPTEPVFKPTAATNPLTGRPHPGMRGDELTAKLRNRIAKFRQPGGPQFNLYDKEHRGWVEKSLEPKVEGREYNSYTGYYELPSSHQPKNVKLFDKKNPDPLGTDKQKPRVSKVRKANGGIAPNYNNPSKVRKKKTATKAAAKSKSGYLGDASVNIPWGDPDLGDEVNITFRDMAQFHRKNMWTQKQGTHPQIWNLGPLTGEGQGARQIFDAAHDVENRFIEEMGVDNYQKNMQSEIDHLIKEYGEDPEGDLSFNEELTRTQDNLAGGEDTSVPQSRRNEIKRRQKKEKMARQRKAAGMANLSKKPWLQKDYLKKKGKHLEKTALRSNVNKGVNKVNTIKPNKTYKDTINIKEEDPDRIKQNATTIGRKPTYFGKTKKRIARIRKAGEQVDPRVKKRKTVRPDSPVQKVSQMKDRIAELKTAKEHSHSIAFRKHEGQYYRESKPIRNKRVSMQSIGC